MKIAIYLPHPEVPCWNFDDTDEAHLKRRFPDLDCIRCRTSGEFVSALRTATTALCWTFRQEWFDGAPVLKKIITPAAGADYFSVDPPKGVAVETSGFHGPIMAETALAMILAQCRGIGDAAEETREGHLWPRRELGLRIRLLAGSRVTVWGWGRIGSAAGRLLAANGARVTGIRRNPTTEDSGCRIIGSDRLEETLNETDHLLLILPRTPETDRILDAETLGMLKRGAAVYNLGRGSAIDEAALAEAVRSGAVAGAWLDVATEEPLTPNSPLAELRGVRFLPHVSAVTPDYLRRFIDELKEKNRLV